MQHKFYNIPEELRALPNWVLWKSVMIEGRRKPTKKPFGLNGWGADPTKVETCCTFEQAFNMFQMGHYDGLGFVFTGTPYTGIDLDDARYTSTGEPNPNYEADYARQIKVYTEFNSYSERSPSGIGCHIIVRGKSPDEKKLANIELYPTNRFFTMTGEVANAAPIVDRTEMLHTLYAQMGGGEKKVIDTVADKVAKLTDKELIDLALAHNTATFEPLHNGIWQANYATQSEADQAYMNILAYYTDNRAQCSRIFKASKMYRAPPIKNKDYVARTMKTAFDQKVVIDFDGIDMAWDNIKSQATVAKVAKTETVKSDVIFPPGLMGEIAQFIYDAAPKPVREIALAGSIGLMAGICGKAFNVNDLGLNQYILMLASTGKGKEAMSSGISKLISAAKIQVPTAGEFIGPSAIASKQGLHKYLVKTSPCFVSIIGEFGHAMKVMVSNKATTHQIELQAALLDIYHKSGHNDTYGGSAYSDQEKNSIAISSPSFSILGEGTPEIFYNELDDKMIMSGLLPRFTIIEYNGPRVPSNKNKNVSPPIPMLNAVTALMAQAKTNINAGKVTNVQFTADASILADFIDKYADDKVNDNPDKQHITALWNRAHVKAMKLAALVAVGVNMFEPVITVDHLNWAMALVDNDIKSLSEKFENGEVGLNNDEVKQTQEIERCVRDYHAKDADYIKKYGGFEKLRAKNIINNQYFSARLPKMAVFKNDRFGGGKALIRAIQLLVDNGKLIEIKPGDPVRDGYAGKCFKIHNSIIDV